MAGIKFAGAEYTALSVFALGRYNMKPRSRLHASILDRDPPTFVENPLALNRGSPVVLLNLNIPCVCFAGPHSCFLNYREMARFGLCRSDRRI